MKEIKNLIDTMLDDLKDIKCLYEKAKYSKKENHRSLFNFYYDRAMKRIDGIKEEDKMLYEIISEYKKMKGTETREEDNYIWECLYGSLIDNVNDTEKELREFKG